MKYAERQIRNLEIVSRLRMGLPVADVAKEFGLTTQELYLISKGRFKTTPPQGFHSANKKRYLEIARMREDGATLTEVGNKYHLTRERTRQICNFVSRKDWEVGRERNAQLIEKVIGCPISEISTFKRRCLRCGRIDGMKPKVKICPDCGDVLKRTMGLSYRILCKGIETKTNSLPQAAWQIRKNKITAKEFRSVWAVKRKGEW